MAAPLHSLLQFGALDHPLLKRERRRQLPVAFTAILFILILAITSAIHTVRHMSYQPHPVWAFTTETIGAFFDFGLVAATIVTAILGINAMKENLNKSATNDPTEFSFSRNRLFWTKYAYAVVCVTFVAAAFTAPYLFALRYLDRWDLLQDFRPFPLEEGILYALSLNLLLSLSLLIAALTRNFIAAALLVVVTCAALFFITLAGFNFIFATFHPSEDRSFPLIILYFLLISLIATVIARSAFTKNWRII